MREGDREPWPPGALIDQVSHDFVGDDDLPALASRLLLALCLQLLGMKRRHAHPLYNGLDLEATQQLETVNLHLASERLDHALLAGRPRRCENREPCLRARPQRTQ